MSEMGCNCGADPDPLPSRTRPRGTTAFGESEFLDTTGRALEMVGDVSPPANATTAFVILAIFTVGVGALAIGLSRPPRP